MGYRIQYGIARVDKLSKRMPRKWLWITALFLPVAVVAAQYLWPEWMKSFREELFPLFSEEGLQMVETFQEYMKAQGGMIEAVQVFIQEVIADVSQ